MSWKDSLQKGQEIVLGTCSKDGGPHNIIVISLGLVNDKLLIGACQMKTSLKNMKDNNKVSIVAKYKKEYYRIDGNANIYSSGEYFDTATKRSNPPLPKHAVVIDIKEVFDLDKVRKIL